MKAALAPAPLERRGGRQSSRDRTDHRGTLSSALLAAGPRDAPDLRRFTVFAELSHAQLATVHARLSFRETHAGEITSFYGDTSERFFLAWSGAHRATILSPSGLHVTIRTLRPGDHFGECAIFFGARQSYYNLVCDAHGLLLELSGKDLKRFVDDMPGLRHRMLENIAREALLGADRIYEFAALNGKARLQAELLRLCAQGVPRDGVLLIAPAPTHEAIASQVGVTREVVTRHLKSLAQAGLIRSRRGQIEVFDVERLRASVEREAGKLMSYEELRGGKSRK